MPAKPAPVFHTLTSDDWRRAIASARRLDNPIRDAIQAKLEDVKHLGRPRGGDDTPPPDLRSSGHVGSGLREPRADEMGYFVVSEPNGVTLVAARSARQAQALYFDAVKDELGGDSGNPEPYLSTQIHARPATPDDLRDFRVLRIVPAKVPLRPTVLNERIDPMPHATAGPLRPAGQTAFSP
jgi:hypothetical protein